MKNLEMSENIQPEWKSDSPGISDSPRVFTKRSQIAEQVGFPILSSCQDLYDKNIQTTSSIWKKTEVLNHTGCTIITVDYNTLSDENKRIAEEIAKEQKTQIYDSSNFDGSIDKVFEVRTNVTPNLSPLEIERLTREKVARFKWQPMTWAPKRTLESIQEMFGDPTMSLEEAIDDMGKEFGMYYDSEEGVFYPTKESYDKSKQQKSSQNPQKN